MKPKKINKKKPQVKRLNKLNNKMFQNNKKKYYMKKMKLK